MQNGAASLLGECAAGPGGLTPGAQEEHVCVNGREDVSRSVTGLSARDALLPGAVGGPLLPVRPRTAAARSPLAVCAVLARQRGWVRGGQPDTERVGRFAKGRGLLVF